MNSTLITVYKANGDKVCEYGFTGAAPGRPSPTTYNDILNLIKTWDLTNFPAYPNTVNDVEATITPYTLPNATWFSLTQWGQEADLTTSRGGTAISVYVIETVPTGIYIWTNEIKDIFVWEWIDDYSAMRWPCPEGFHVPINSEWTAVKTVWTSLWGGASDWNNFGIAFKLPKAWYRSYWSWWYNNWSKWSQSRYRASTSYRDYSAKTLTYTASAIDADASSSKAIGGSIRPFKNKAVVPTSSWTKLYWTSIEAWGIFWSSTDGLISLSSDWQTWITIADKNLWATTVWNDGDTLTEANCGWYFQWWNNYMFPFTWTVTTSSTQVDASNYWPWNYYYSDIFTTTSSNSVWWDSSNNTNIRWGETWITKKWNVIEVYVGTTKIRPNMPAEFTDWESSVWDYVSQAFSDAGYDIWTAIANLFGWDFAQSIETATWTYLSDWEFSPIMPFYPITTSWYGLQISNWWDMIDKHLVPESPWYTQSICIIRDNDNLSDAEYIVWTYDSNDDWFDYQLSSLASHFSGKDTVCMFIFLM